MIIYGANTAFIHNSRTKAAAEKKPAKATDKKPEEPKEFGAAGLEKKGANQKMDEDKAKKELPNVFKEVPAKPVEQKPVDQNKPK